MAINRKKLLKKILLTLLIIPLVLVMLHVGALASLVIAVKKNSRIDKSITLTDSTGDKFTVKINGGESNLWLQPIDYSYTISVKYKNTVLYSFKLGDSNFTLEYARRYLKETKIEKEYHEGNVHAYKFPFAIIYSFNDKKTFYSVSDKDYLYFSKRDSEFKEIYDLLYDYSPA